MGGGVQPPPSPSLSPSKEMADLPKLLYGEETEEELVMSEVHLGCPPGFSGPLISRFTFSLPIDVEPSRYTGNSQSEVGSTNQAFSLDEDGDLVLPRRNRVATSAHSYTATIRHNITSTLPSVGLQVWKAELVLSDFVLHNMFSSPAFDGIVAVELGAGTGLVGMLLARVAKTVFLTDKGDDILDNCAQNVGLNSRLFSSKAVIHVRELDWMKPWPPPGDQEGSTMCSRYSWASMEIEEAQRASLLLAADVIYSDDLTDAFFSTLEKLMCQGSEKVLYLALEKCYNFTLDDLAAVANGYSHFLSYLRVEGEFKELVHSSECNFQGKRIDLTTIPQYISDYERGTDVEVWQIKYNRKTP